MRYLYNVYATHRQTGATLRRTAVTESEALRQLATWANVGHLNGRIMKCADAQTWSANVALICMALFVLAAIACVALSLVNK